MYRRLGQARFTPGHVSRLGWILLWLGVIASAFSLMGRYRREMRPSPVEMVVSWDDVQRCASAWGIPDAQLLRELRARGVRGVVCPMPTVESLSKDGRISLLPRTAAARFSPELRRIPLAYCWVLWSRDAALFAQIKTWLGRQPGALPPRVLKAQGFPRSRNAKSGSLRAMALALSSAALQDWPVGFDTRQIALLRAAHLELVARLTDPDNASASLIEAMLHNAKQEGARFWVPFVEVPGYTTLLPITSSVMRRDHLAMAFVEGDDARGLNDIARDAHGWLIRAQATGPLDTQRLQPGELLDRYARAARERNARVLFVLLPRQLHGDGSGLSPHAQNLAFIEELGHAITSDPPPWRGLRPRLTLGLARPFGLYPTSSVRAFLSRVAAGIGALGAALLLLGVFFELSPRQIFWWGSAGWGLVLLLALSPGSGAQLLAFVAAILFPVVALLWSGLPGEALNGEGPRLSRRAGLHLALRVLGRATGISIAGGIVVAAALNDWTFALKVADFWGTKAGGILPLLLAGLAIAGNFWPNETHDPQAHHSGWGYLRYRLRMWSARPFTIGAALSIALTIGIISLWLARSGNDSGVAVSTFEWQFRALLEKLFIARPRSKEFLVCHPALLLGTAAWLCRKRFAPGLLLLGLIGQISVINSFAQANNPLYIALWRTLLALVPGAALGAALLWLVAPHWGLVPDARPWHGWSRARRWALVAGGALALLSAIVSWNRYRRYARLIAPSPQATWPWPAARHERLLSGVEHWLDTSSPDGTTLDLLSFDFAANPRLRFELFDSDLASTLPDHPPANRFAYWKSGLGQVAHRLNEERAGKVGGIAGSRGTLVAAWNGGFWGLLNLKPRTADRSFHLSPIVEQGRVFYPGLSRRWTWGAKIVAGRPVFALEHTPGNRLLARRFDWGTGTLQALLKDGRPLEVSQYPWFDAPPEIPTSNPQQAGAIAVLDQMHTSRIGVGWTPSGRLFVLIVKEPDGEAPSRAAVNAWQPGRGGWTLQDHQNFWLAMRRAYHVQNAVGLDGGDVAQAVFRRPDGSYTLLVPRLTIPPAQRATLRLHSGPDFSAPPVRGLHGAALNYFVVRQIP